MVDKLYVKPTASSEDANSYNVKKNVFYGGMIPRNCAAVTPSDADDLAVPGILYITGTGDVKVDMVGTGTVTLTVTANTFLKIQVKKVYATGTDATGIYVFY